MTTQTEAMKLALEALESATPKYTRQRADQKTLGGALDYWKLEQHQRLKAITSLRQAIAEAEKQEQGEPVGEMTPRRAEMFMSRFKHEEKMLGPNEQAALDYVIAMLVAKQEQGEPVAWWIPKAEQFCLPNANGERPFAKAWEPLYTTPQQRTWVGLTIQEANELWESTDSDWELMKRVEAKLKEKNT